MTQEESLAAAALITIIFGILFAIFYGVPVLIIFWILAKKAGKPGWSQLIPGYSSYIQGIIAKKPKLAVFTAVATIVYDVTYFVGLRTVAGFVAIVWLVPGLIQLRAFILQYNAGVGKWILFLLFPIVGVFLVNKTQYKGTLPPQSTPVAGAPVQPVAPIQQPAVPTQPIVAQPTQPTQPVDPSAPSNPPTAPLA